MSPSPGHSNRKGSVDSAFSSKPDSYDCVGHQSGRCPLSFTCSHRVLRYFFPTLFACVSLTSVILLFLGIYWDQRHCLTAGCILGLTCFGMFLHACLRHRSIPDLFGQTVLSATYLYPIGGSQFLGEPDTSTAVVAATLLPMVTHQPRRSAVTSSFIASTLERFILDQRRSGTSSLPEASVHTNRGTKDEGQICLINDNLSTPTTVSATRGQNADSGAYSKPGSHTVQSRCINSVDVLPRHSSKTVNFRENEDTTNDSTEFNSKSLHGLADHGKERTMYQLRESSASQPIGSNSGEVNDVAGGDSLPVLTEQIAANPGTTCLSTEPSCLPLAQSTDRKVIFPSIRLAGSAVSRENYPNLLQFIAECSVDHDYARRSRGSLREREGLFGPRVWSGWHSWIDH